MTATGNLWERISAQRIQRRSHVEKVAAYRLVACFGKWGEEEVTLGAWPEMPGINQCSRLLTAAARPGEYPPCGHVLCPDGTHVRRYHDSHDKYED